MSVLVLREGDKVSTENSYLWTWVSCRFGVWIYINSPGTSKPRNYQKRSLHSLTFRNQAEANANPFWKAVPLNLQRFPQITAFWKWVHNPDQYTHYFLKSHRKEPDSASCLPKLVVPVMAALINHHSHTPWQSFLSLRKAFLKSKDYLIIFGVCHTVATP